MSNFTVKVRDSDALGGGEALFSCDKIEIIWPKRVQVAGSTESQTNWDKAGIYLDPEPMPDGEGMAAREIVLFGGDHTEHAEKRKGGKVWVMNEAGQTVATYDL